MRKRNQTVILKLILCIAAFILAACEVIDDREKLSWIDCDINVTEAAYNDTIKLRVKNYDLDDILFVSFPISTYTSSGAVYYSAQSGINSRIDKKSGSIVVPFKACSGEVIGYGPYGSSGGSKKRLRILYPEKLTLSANSLKPGDEVTITSSEPFFDPSSFSTGKIEKLLGTNYYIVWVEADMDQYRPDNGLEFCNENREKRPVPSSYYKTITPTEITFIIPDFAKTGRIHVINEYGFLATGENNPLVTKDDAPAFFCTANDLRIVN